MDTDKAHEAQPAARSSKDALATIAASSFWVWLNLFHEMGRNQLMSVQYAPGMSFPVNLGGLHCTALPFGLFLGSLLCFMLSRKGRVFTLSPGRLRTCFFMLLALEGLHYAAFFLMHAYYLMIMIFLLINIIAAFILIRVVALSARFTVRSTAIVVVSCVLAYAAADGVMVLASPFVVSPLLGEIAHAAVLLLAFLAARRLEPNAEEHLERAALAHRPHGESESNTVPSSAFSLIAHLLLIGIVLGSLHSVGSGFVYGEANGTAAAVEIANLRNLPLVASSLIAAAIIWREFAIGTPKSGDIWKLIRIWVVPFSVGGFLLLPLVSLSGLAAIPLDAGAVLYQLLFVFACGRIIRESDYSPTFVVSCGFMTLNFGWAIGDFACVVLLRGVSQDHVQLAAMTFVVFMLSAIATLWIGSDGAVKKLWGLRRNHSAKMFHDLVIQKKCRMLAQSHDLTKREEEVLVLLAAGKRPAQIGKELYISSNTVRTHLQNAYAKLGVHSVKDVNAVLDAVYADAEP